MAAPTVRDVDAPRCPVCGYVLTGLTQPRCPECGLNVGADVDIYRPSRRMFLLVGLRWYNIWRPSLQVLLFPWRLARPIPDFHQEPAVARRFILAWTLAAFALYFPLRWLIRAIAILVVLGPAAAWEHFQESWSRWVTPAELSRAGAWMVWSTFGWWLLAAAVIFAWSRVARSGRVAIDPAWPRRLLLLAPWIVAVDLLVVLAARLCMPMTVPEPNSSFVTPFSFGLLFKQPWPARMLPIALFLGATFMIAGGVRPRIAILVGLLLAPFATLLVMLWSLAWWHFTL